MSNKQEKKYDPGWNDPPMLNYSPANPPPKSRIVNKRVAFPLFSSDSSSSSSNEQGISGMPPILSPLNKNIVPTSNQQTIPTTNFEDTIPHEQWSSEVQLKVITENINKILPTIPPIDKDMLDKYELMKNMWYTSKLSLKCQKDLLDIVNMILKRDYGNAEELKHNMLKENTVQCNAWIEFISHLINAYKQSTQTI